MEIVRYLLENQADPCITDNLGGMALHYAASNGFADTVAVLLENAKIRSTINHRGDQGYTPLCYTLTKITEKSRQKKRQTAELLIKHKADLSIPTNNNNMAFHLAAEAGHIDFIALFLHHGAKINAPGWDGRTALQLTEAKAPYPEKLAVTTLLKEFSAR